MDRSTTAAIACEECAATAEAVRLRTCDTCGHVGCAEGSPDDHAKQHYAETDHPVAAGVGAVLPPRWSYPEHRPV
jgi:uncharacterized UBP type Zn finger protein